MLEATRRSFLERDFSVEQDCCVGGSPLDSLRTSYASVQGLAAGRSS